LFLFFLLYRQVVLGIQDDEPLMDGTYTIVNRPAKQPMSVPVRQEWQPNIDPSNDKIAMYLKAVEHPSATTNDIELVECTKCKRSFAVDRIDRHQQNCKGSTSRKPFDATKMRLQGTDFAKYSDVSVTKSKSEPPLTRKVR
jgi:zinc-finger of a C2HC-type